MIEVSIQEDGEEYAVITVKKLESHLDGTADYSVKYAVNRGTAIGFHQRGLLYFPHRKYNVLALLKQALETLSEDELLLEDDYSTATSRADNFFTKLKELINHDIQEGTDPDAGCGARK